MSLARRLGGIVRLDLKGIARDHVALATLLLSCLGTAVIAALGTFQDRLPGWTPWFPFILAASLVGGPGGFGFLFGLLLVEENDTGVRDALAITPVPLRLFLLVRTVVATLWMVAWPLASVHLMNYTWQAVDLSLAAWLTIIVPLALFTPAFALLIPALARDKVGALAIFKGLSFLSLIPLALFIVPAAAPYRLLFLVSPTAWTVETFQALLAGHGAAALRWAGGALLYGVALLALVVHHFRRAVYRLNR